MGVLTIYKPVGKTPLDMLNQMDSKEKKTYAGRLDPMAHGVLLVLIGEHCKKQTLYHNFDKKYQFQLLLGFETDTLDILGIIKKKDTLPQNLDLLFYSIKSILKNMEGKHKQLFPNYSSVHVNSKPLWWWAQNDKLDEIEIPSKIIEIYGLSLLHIKFISGDVLKQIILEKLDKLGDRDNNFREKEIKKQWNSTIFKEKYPIITICANVSTGTYIRQLCKTISNQLDSSGIALDIYRHSVGEYICSNF